MKKLFSLICLLLISSMLFAKGAGKKSYQEIITQNGGKWTYKYSVKTSRGQAGCLGTWIFTKTGKNAGTAIRYGNCSSFPAIDDIETGKMKGNLYYLEADYKIDGDKLILTYTKLIEGHQEFDSSIYIGASTFYTLATNDEGKLLVQSSSNTLTLSQ